MTKKEIFVTLSYWDEELNDPIIDKFEIGEVRYSILLDQFKKFGAYKKV